MITSVCPTCRKMRGDDGRCRDCDVLLVLEDAPPTLPEGLEEATRFAAEANTSVTLKTEIDSPEWLNAIRFQVDRIEACWKREFRFGGKMTAALAALPLFMVLSECADAAREILIEESSRR